MRRADRAVTDREKILQILDACHCCRVGFSDPVSYTHLASLAEAYDSTGELEENWDFRLSLSLFSDVGEAEAQVCDENGFVVLCSCDEFNCEHLGRQIDADLITEIDKMCIRDSAGQEAGGALADVLTAKVMPSGHLSFTWPENAEAFDEACAAVDQFTGYRYFDSFGTPVRYPFGYGLGYGKIEFGSVSAGLDLSLIHI